jgi:hypothetical protein
MSGDSTLAMATCVDGGALIGQGAVLVWNDIADEGRDEFYEWHDKEHVPERLGIPGFRRGRRFVKRSHSPEWFTMYEADDVSVVTSADYLARLNAPTPATLRTLQYFRNTSRAVCRIVHSVGGSTGGHVFVLRLNVPSECGDELCNYLVHDFFPRAMSFTGVIACHLFVADEAASHIPTAESRTRALDVPSWVVLCEATTLAAGDRAKRLFESGDLDRLGVGIRDAATYALEICRLSLPCKHC